MLIGENIRFYRQQHALSQEELAEKMDTSRQTISSWENGKTYPNIQSLISLSNIFNTSVEDLIKEEVEDMKQSVERNTHPLKRNKDREVLNRLAAVRLFNVGIGAFLLFPVWTYLDKEYVIIPIAMLVAGFSLTFPIEHYRRKYNLKKYQDIVDFLDEKYK